MDNRFSRAGKAFETLCRTMATLRAPGGCPWDREQTFDSLKPYLIEEAYEALEAIESGDAAAHRDELGDVLLQIVFHSEIAQETDLFDAAQVAMAINDKLTRRHPHVFPTQQSGGSGEPMPGPDNESRDEAMQRWERIKAVERGGKGGVLDGVPRALPGLTRAHRTSEKAAAVGFDWSDRHGSAAKVAEEWQELQDAIATGDRAAITDELGDVFFALVNLSRHLQQDPEEAMRHAIEKFQKRFRYVELKLTQAGQNFGATSLDQMNLLWEEAKSKTSPKSPVDNL